jgi:hypothetical protein
VNHTTLAESKGADDPVSTMEPRLSQFSSALLDSRNAPDFAMRPTLGRGKFRGNAQEEVTVDDF